jgi:hypothetical protein
MDILLPEFKDLLLLLNKHKVNYMLIGGYAVIYYGYHRNTGDLDIWLQPTNSNKEKVVEALKEFGVGESSLNAVSILNFEDIQLFYVGKIPRRIDFINMISGVSFEEAKSSVTLLPLSDELIPIIAYDHLILSKISNNRAKDKSDVEELQRIKKFRKNH